MEREYIVRYVDADARHSEYVHAESMSEAVLIFESEGYIVYRCEVV